MTRITIPIRLGSLAAALALLGFAAGCNSQNTPSTDSATPGGATVSAAPNTSGQPAPPGPQSSPGAVRSMEEQHRDKAGK